MIKVYVGISTANERIKGALAVAETAKEAKEILICHQIFDDKEESHQIRPDGRLHIFQMKGGGLSRSRNEILKNSPEGSILVPTDDDVVFLPDAIEKIQLAFENNPSADIITFKALNDRGDYFKKTYKNRSFVHNSLTIRSVSSIEIAVRVDALREANLCWDENFGLGAKYGGGLELVFLKDAIDKGLKLVYEPISIVSHPVESSGYRFDEKKAFIRGAIAYRMYRDIGLFLAFYTTIRHRERIIRFTSPWRYFRSFVEGFFEYRREAIKSI